MIRTTLEAVEALRVMRCEGGLVIKGTSAENAVASSEAEPRIRHNASVLEIYVPSAVELEVPPGVALEALDCAGNVTVRDFDGPLVLGRIRGNLKAERIGSLALRGEVDGDVAVTAAGTVETGEVNGSVRVSAALSLRATHVLKDVECRSVEDVSVDDVGGRLSVANVTTVRAGRVAGRCDIRQVGGIDLDSVGGKLTVARIAGDVTARFVAGHVSLASVGGDIRISEAGGAIDLLGPFPSAGEWNLTGRGSIRVEIPSNASCEIRAVARSGRVRMHHVSSEDLKLDEQGHVEGKFGNGAGPTINLESTGSDIHLSREDVETGEQERAHRGRRSRLRHHLGTQFDDLREEIPVLVNEVVGAAGRIFSESGKRTGAVAQEVGKGVVDTMREIERAISELEEKAPRDVSEKLAKLGRRLGEVVERAVDDARERRRSARERRASESGRSDESEETATSRDEDAGKAESDTAKTDKANTGPADAEKRDRALLEILKAVRDGHLEPEDAETLINSWLALKRTTDGKSSQRSREKSSR